MTCEIHHGDSLALLRTMDAASVDAIVTDPPYGLAFMGKRWDYDVPAVELWAECLRVIKPGGHLLAFAGTRTQHRMAVRIEDGGWEIRDMIAWVYGSGFPKSLDVSKAIDKAAGAVREGGTRRVAADKWTQGGREALARGESSYEIHDGAPATDAARQWSGWGTALKPALEPITLARAPFRGTVADNVQRYGTGAINVDGCRVEGGGKSMHGGARARAFADGGHSTGSEDYAPRALGRFPANFIHDGSEEIVALFPDGAKPKPARVGRRGGRGGALNMGLTADAIGAWPADEGGSAARFFYCAKASKRERGDDNNHPTVKPLALMRYLVRLVTPPGGIVLDPFMGSGTTALACRDEGFRFVGIEREAQYIEIARRRLAGVAGLLELDTPDTDPAPAPDDEER